METAHPIVRKYLTFLKLEKSLSNLSVEAYLSDLQKLIDYAGGVEKLLLLNAADLEEFLCQLRDCNIQARSQARILSGIKSFYRFLLIEDFLQVDPTELVDAPKLGRHLPEVLSVEEIDKIIGCIDLSTKEGQRNKAMLETLYSCGLRVSELLTLKLSNCYFEEEYLMVEGKGNKQRLVPISQKAIREIMLWLPDRSALEVKKGQEDFVFLNRRGSGLSRSMVFRIIQELAGTAGITKTISPHTFRHSFATHLLEGGANLRFIQQMLGHESIQTTEIYTHMDKTYLRDQILRFHPRNN
ncbi:MAG TPA: site-specific tyrosine recombinase XerD [Bacteroidales bacterium]|nr:site-specific tyrosine recombinase XerD [Bacteroidales bacterium]